MGVQLENTNLHVRRQASWTTNLQLAIYYMHSRAFGNLSVRKVITESFLLWNHMILQRMEQLLFGWHSKLMNFFLYSGRQNKSLRRREGPLLKAWSRILSYRGGWRRLVICIVRWRRPIVRKLQIAKKSLSKKSEERLCRSRTWRQRGNKQVILRLQEVPWEFSPLSIRIYCS